MPKIPYQYISELGLDGQARVYNTLDSERKNQYGSLDLEPAKSVISRAAHKVFPGEPISLVSGKSPLYDPEQIARSVVPERFLEAQIRRVTGKLISFDDDVLFLDIETHNAEKRWGMDRYDFVRLCQYAWGDGEVVLTEDVDELLEQMGKARRIVAHNGHNFDFSVLLGDDALHWAYNERLFDTYVYANMNFPAPTKYTHANGYTYVNHELKPYHIARWLGLENLAFQFGFEGKLGNLQELAQRHNPKGTKVADLDYGLIPVDDPDFQGYAKQDIPALRELTRSMLSVSSIDEYDWREQFKWAVLSQFTRNGVAVDIPEISRRIENSKNTNDAIVSELVKDYGFPTSGKKPWSSNEGKQAIQNILASHGVTPQTVEWKKTAKGALSFGKDTLIEITQGTSAEDVGTALAALQGDRGLPQQVASCIKNDGLIHPDIESLQRSGRSSVTSPGLTTWGSRTDKGREDKEYFIPRPGNVFLEIDLSNADQRAVAFMSKDPQYAKRFLPGVDGHEITGRLMFGDEVYDADPHGCRNIAKALSHAYAYGAGAKRLAVTARNRLPHLSIDEILVLAEKFVETMESNYPGMTRWQNAVRREGQSGWITNIWGRRCPVDKERAYTQAPALAGQSSTTELLLDTWIAMYEGNRDSLKHVLFPIHDAILCEVPMYEARAFSQYVTHCADQTINGIEIFMEAGEPGVNWSDAMHG